ncbi:hypothetical protein K2173_024780 [Erythroxylum novogranatense]|uniref:Hydroxyproline-rich glycoprotein family protein n=1 Tax=Erythroxylum novogranatense TaxID=1862640 RepID=A0AAV8SW41_9ROSI|nr:hypothetical protein K2173_024780 [Erythroxylum novogranatense]
MQEEEELPPFWLQTTTTLHRGRRRRSNPFSSSIFLNSGLLLIALLVIAFVLIFIVVPSLTSFTSQILRPHSIRKGWDSLNLVLVLFAILCGFLSRNNNSDNNSQSAGFYGDQSLSGLRQDSQKSHPSTPRTWYDQDRATYNGLSRLRSFSSYPDLRQESNWITNEERWRFYDDTHLHSYRASSSYQINPGDPPTEKEEESSKNEEAVQEGVDTKDIHVVTSVISHQKEVIYKPPPENPSPPRRPPSPPPTKSSSPPQPPLSGATSKVVKRKVKRTYHDLGHHEKRSEDRNLEVVTDIYIPPPSPPPPPPAPFNENEKRRGKDSFLVSLRRKKKKQRQKSVENLASLFDHPQTSHTLITPSPPPPPPPPPPHFFQNIFTPKRGKTKKIHSVPPPPPPPPPSFTMTQPLQTRASKTNSQVAQVTSNKPPKPVKTNTALEENVDSGNASPLIPIPPPPPPPPFKMPPWRFVVEGDYIRVGSFNSSLSGSPDSDNLEDPSDKESSDSPMADGGGTAALFCPSPDVNTKADNFIARVRAGLMLEKANSVKGRSNLGIESSSVNEGEGRS